MRGGGIFSTYGWERLAGGGREEGGGNGGERGEGGEIRKVYTLFSNPIHPDFYFISIFTLNKNNKLWINVQHVNCL